MPSWVTGPFTSVTRTPDELSVVCRAERVPAEVPGEDGWRCLVLDDTFDLSLVGVLHSVTQPLAAAGVSVFPIATHDTDYVLVRRFEAAVRRSDGRATRSPATPTDPPRATLSWSSA